MSETRAKRLTLRANFFLRELFPRGFAHGVPVFPTMKPLPAEQVAFAAALHCATAADRAACLDACCGDDTALRRRVEALLMASEEAGDFLEVLPEKVRGAAAAHGGDQSGEHIGRYKLLEKIGEGGCGVVYMAEQKEPVRRRVALKIIKLGMDTREVIARFEAERQALAMMDHPNIARVFDGGATPAGRPYFAMELVRGSPVTVFCDEARLPTAGRLQLFLQVCLAVQHAHQKGVIHRDLKPSNILVTVNDGVPVPKVIDFGIAKATGMRLTDKSLFTQFHAFIGTPAYTSPEQAEMSSVDVDTRSDIYSLGVLLYELLTSRTPFDGEELLRSGLDEMRRIIRTAEPPRPSSRLQRLTVAEATDLSARRLVSVPQLTGDVRGDLDWIVMRCLEKDRTRRYGTASELAADVQRHLNDEPIAARPPGQFYRFSKLVRRNKGTFAALTTIALVLCAGIVVSATQAMRARRGEARARAALDELRDSAPVHAAQAQTLAINAQFAAAIEKLDYAIRLRPMDTGYLMAKADLLECQLRFSEAAAVYRTVVEVDPAHTGAQTRLALCTQLAQPGVRTALWHDVLARLYLELVAGRNRSLTEIFEVATLVREHAMEQLKAHPSTEGKALADCLRLGADGHLTVEMTGSSLSDLSPLQGLPIKTLNAERSAVADLSPLRGSPLRSVNVNLTKVTDLEPLRGMAGLESLSIAGTAVTDFTPLHGLPKLTRLQVEGSAVQDLTPLRGTNLTVLRIAGTRVKDLAPLAALPLNQLDCADIPAVDLSPLAACPQLTHLNLTGTAVKNLEAFRGCRLQSLDISRTQVRDLSPLVGMPLHNLILFDTAVTDITPLLSSPTLLQVGLSRGVKNAALLRGLPRLRHISFQRAKHGAPAQTAAEFWGELDGKAAE
jgi:serine/threonine protein kinase